MSLETSTKRQGGFLRRCSVQRGQIAICALGGQLFIRKYILPSDGWRTKRYTSVPEAPDCCVC
jgi:hypothetical protein